MSFSVSFLPFPDRRCEAESTGQGVCWDCLPLQRWLQWRRMYSVVSAVQPLRVDTVQPANVWLITIVRTLLCGLLSQEGAGLHSDSSGVETEGPQKCWYHSIRPMIESEPS